MVSCCRALPLRLTLNLPRKTAALCSFSPAKQTCSPPPTSPQSIPPTPSSALGCDKDDDPAAACIRRSHPPRGLVLPGAVRLLPPCLGLHRPRPLRGRQVQHLEGLCRHRRPCGRQGAPGKGRGPSCCSSLYLSALASSETLTQRPSLLQSLEISIQGGRTPT